MNAVFLLYAQCIPVKGAKRSIICDLQKNSYHFIPTDLYSILTNTPKALEELYIQYGLENKNVVDEYFEFLQSNDLGFWTTDPHLFPRLNMDWDEPSLITNAIIDFDQHSTHNLDIITNSLEQVGCRDIQLRFFDLKALEYVVEIVDSFKNKRIKSLELLVKYDEKVIYNDVLPQLLESNPRLKSIIIHSCSGSEMVENSRGAFVYKTSQLITDETHCGVVSPAYFVNNIKSFTESVNFNSCLNRKLSIDRAGMVKQCPSMKSNYGHYKEVSFHEVILKTSFRDAWSMNKDRVSVCKDCEFRYICPDCRAYTKDSLADSKPAKCSYDPYTATWNA